MAMGHLLVVHNTRDGSVAAHLPVDVVVPNALADEYALNEFRASGGKHKMFVHIDKFYREAQKKWKA